MEVAGDEAKKAELEALVNAGKLSREEAVAIAEKLGLVSAPTIERTTSLSKTTQLYNFSVYKWSKGRTVQRLILQFDFQSATLSSIQHGTRTKKLDFNSIVSYQSDDGCRLSIKFTDQPEYELDADTAEDKNKMCRILELIIRNYKQSIHQTENEKFNRDSLVEEIESEEKVTFDEDAEESESFYQTNDTPSSGTPKLKRLPSIEPSTCIIPTVVAGVPIKEGMVEKRGHSAKYLMFSRRWLRVFEGELLYYKPDDLENALNIVPLNHGVTEVTSVGTNQILVALTGSDKKFNFRTLPSGSRSAEQVRDDWCTAIRNGMFRQSSSGGSLNRTYTAKDLAAARRQTLKKQQKKPASIDSYVDPFENSEIGSSLKADMPPSNVNVSSGGTRHWSISGLKTRLSSFKKSQSVVVPVRDNQDESAYSRRRDRSKTASTFYDDENMSVTKNVSEPADFKSLELRGKSMNELLMLLKPEFDSLGKILEGMTTGSSKLDMMVARLSSIINALQNSYTDVTGEELSENLSEQELSKRLSVLNESEESAGSAITSPGRDSSRGSRPTSGTKFSDTENVLEGSKSPLSPVHSDDSLSNKSTSIKLSGSTSPSETEVMSPTHNTTTPPDLISPSSPDHTSESLPPVPEMPPSVPGMPPPVPGMPPPVPGMPPPVPGGVPPPPPPPITGMPPAFPGAPPPPLPPGVPPPPGLLGGLTSAILPQRKLVQPGVKMRRFYWSALPPQQVMKCGWMDWAESDYTDSLDLKGLEELFGMQENKQKQEPIKKKVEMKTLLDNTRSRNIEIFLPRFPLSIDSLEDTLSDHLNNINESTELGIDHVVALKRYQPTEEDKEMYKNYKGDRSLLQQADIFLMKLGNIPMLSTRLDLLFTIKEFPANFEGFQPTLQLAWQSTEELKSSKNFVEVLKFILAIGNYMNFGTRQGAAYGYKLSVLPKLSESAGQDKKTTLMHYLILQLHKIKPELLELPTELESVSKSSDISITGISAELEVMQKELDKMERFTNKIVEHSGIPSAAGQKLLNQVKKFTAMYRDKLSALNKKGIEMNENFREILIKFGEPLTTDSEDFFSCIAKFLSHFRRIHAELFPPPKAPTPRLERISASPTPTEVCSPTSEIDGNVQVKNVQASSTSTSSNKSTLTPKPPSSPVVLGNKDSNLTTRRGGLGGRSRKLQPKEGMLEKRTRDGRRWQKKHFELERGQLHYYEGKGQKYADTIRLQETPIEIDQTDPKVIIIKGEARSFFLRAESNESARAWFSAINSHSKGV